ncbi:MAG: lysylphosphatidylglycerol synthase transmembrane domain-containing protein [Anaerolineales bacterium]
MTPKPTESSGAVRSGPGAGPARRRRWGWLLWAASPVVLWLALRGIPLAEVGKVLARLGAGQAILIVLINVGVIVVLASRWWMILRAQGHRISIVKVSGYRLAAFAINYFSPGTHVGGEPLQVYLLAKRHGIPARQGAASVLLDRSLDFTANSLFTVIGLAVLIGLGLLQGFSGPGFLIVSLVLLALPIAYLVLVGRGVHPLSSVVESFARRWTRLAPGARFLREAEETVGEFCRDSPRALAFGLALSGLSWLVLILEYSVMLRFLGLSLDLAGTVAALTAGRLALLVPLPGALGVLEGSQVLALTALGHMPAEGAGLGLVIRARDLVFAGAGLLLGAWLTSGRGFLQRDKKP